MGRWRVRDVGRWWMCGMVVGQEDEGGVLDKGGKGRKGESVGGVGNEEGGGSGGWSELIWHKGKVESEPEEI